MPPLSPAQLLERRSFIGASEISWLFPGGYGSELDLFLLKTGKKEPWKGNEATDRGHRLEPFAAARYQIAHPGLDVIVPDPPTVRHPDFEWAACSPDRYTLSHETGELGGVELKTVSFWMWLRTWKRGQLIQQSYLMQVQWTMACTGMDWWDLAALYQQEPDGEFDAFVEWTIHRDEELIEMMMTKARAFWLDHVLTGKPPKSTRRYR